jgi:hypothetical protein
MQKILKPFFSFCRVYIDDIIVFSDSWEKHVSHIKLVIEALRKANLRINVDKSKFGTRSIRFLGHIVSYETISMDPIKIRGIVEFATPVCQQDVQRFLGMSNYYRKFIKNFSKLAAPLHELTSPYTNFVWEDKHKNSFENLKKALASEPVLTQFDPIAELTLEVDASKQGLGVVLTQLRPGEQDPKPVAFISRTLSIAERGYATRELEALAIVWACLVLKYFLAHKPFTVITDHSSLQWMDVWTHSSERVQRWMAQIQGFESLTTWRPGSQNEVADALSRAPATTPIKINMITDKPKAVTLSLKVNDMKVSKISKGKDLELSREYKIQKEKESMESLDLEVEFPSLQNWRLDVLEDKKFGNLAKLKNLPDDQIADHFPLGHPAWKE